MPTAIATVDKMNELELLSRLLSGVQVSNHSSMSWKFVECHLKFAA